MDFHLDPDPDYRIDVPSSELMDVIKPYWARNTIRPSNFMKIAWTGDQAKYSSSVQY